MKLMVDLPDGFKGMIRVRPDGSKFLAINRLPKWFELDIIEPGESPAPNPAPPKKSSGRPKKSPGRPKKAEVKQDDVDESK